MPWQINCITAQVTVVKRFSKLDLDNFICSLLFANVSQEISLLKYIMYCLLMFHSSQALVYKLTGKKYRRRCKKRRGNIFCDVFLWSIVLLRRIMCGMCETFLARTQKWWTPCTRLAWAYSGTWVFYCARSRSFHPWMQPKVVPDRLGYVAWRAGTVRP
jgi:hypothetical protein